MQVKIIGGIYGWRDAQMRVHTVKAGETCEVEDTEGARLCSLGVAVRIEEAEAEPEETGASGESEENPEPETETATEPAYYDRETLDGMKLAGLRLLCETHGAEHTKKMTKAECIAFLLGDDEESLPETGGAGEIVL